ncbi:hypothetical protein LTR62_002393 [Meristemomyces frigidus]|uniref:C3H1-type domain-containing protein n=1 Tax=Meristemomyces frigidus TaxID=1508187 RepID=A0AAN7YS58_9PEZI|nr:hypothetical protein LTR62_002393 [Meristemomyces frigidus]
MNGYRSPAVADGTNITSSHTNRHSVDLSSVASQRGNMQPGINGAAVAMPVGGYAPRYGRMPETTTNFGQLPMPHSPPKTNGDPTYIQPTLGERRLRRSADTKHVPCKFYLQGTCQAGHSCPFSHDLESTTRPMPCKYYSKGACKFGRKCALLHIDANGVVVNRMLPARHNPSQFGQHSAGMSHFTQVPPGLLAQGLDRNGASDSEHYQYGVQNGYEAAVDMTVTSASPQYGSPLQNDMLGGSPSQKGLSVLDAPLPNSFDSNGISLAARHGPFAASVPLGFGMKSPPASLSQNGSSALRDLHSSAFGDRGINGQLAGLGSSPPSGADEPLSFAKRPLHSNVLRATSRQPMISASLGTKSIAAQFGDPDDEDDGGPEREDLLPADLVRDLEPSDNVTRDTPKRREDESAATFLSAARRTLSGHDTPQASRVSSLGSSPSRYSSMFNRSGNTPVEANGVGLIGSPLRNGGLSHIGTPKSNGDTAHVSGSPRQPSMGALTQEFQRTKLETQSAAGAPVSSSTLRRLSNGSTARDSLDRGLSSTSVSRIDEEQEVFRMDEISDGVRSTPRSVPNGETTFGAIGGHRAAR